jgi:hypothetical protein
MIMIVALGDKFRAREAHGFSNSLASTPTMVPNSIGSWKLRKRPEEN